MNTIQNGRWGVRPIFGDCAHPEPGYIAVGFTPNSSTNDDVYVIRTDLNGALLWGYAYDINGASDDYGQSIIELQDGDGYIVAGYTETSGDVDAFMMEIDCSGNPQWRYRYGTNTADEYGYDVIETTTGTGAGHLVLAGLVDRPNNSDANGLIIRVNPAGSPVIWGKEYDNPNPNDAEGFWSLIEATPTTGQNYSGDIVAVGHSGDYNATRDAYMVRADGQNGTISTSAGSLQGAVVLGGGDDDRFYSVIELQNPNETGTTGNPNIVAAGYSYKVPSATPDDRDMYVVKFDDGDPCIPTIQNVIGASGPEMYDEARDIQEITFVPAAGSYYSQWNLAMVGYHKDPPLDPNTALVILTGNTLVPTAGRLYGSLTAGNGAEEGYSLFATGSGSSDGFIICGETTTPWHIDAGGGNVDPGDLHLVRTDNRLESPACDGTWGPGHQEVPWEEQCVQPTLSDNNTEFLENELWNSSLDDDIICTGPSNDGVQSTNKQVQLSDDGNSTLSGGPNPLMPGQGLILLLNGFNTELDLTLNVVNSLGEEITSSYNQFTPATGEILVKTTGWPAGLYHITVQNGERRWTTQVVVLE